MNATLIKAFALLVLVGALFVRAGMLVRRTRTLPGVLQLAGAAFLLIVVATHIAEALHLLPWMHWGEPDSAGHYVDLVSAVLGITLLAAAILVRALWRQPAP